MLHNWDWFNWWYIYIIVKYTEIDFVSIVDPDSNNEMKLHGGVQMVYATGTFEKINAFRAFNSGEMREIFQIGHDGISSFVSARQGAGLE